ncbi:MAG: DUF262 domain-containing protein, partial [Flammeovirgaceae bacterium]|nr:DUF262 domain-containing protein [Flammeovirgaceae bacterium]
MQKYTVNQQLIEALLAWVSSGEIAIPEIQRPFVWDAAKVRDLIDSLYHGYPVGYIIAWRSPNVRLKDGSLSEGKKILIDGQQRITALTAAILGQRVVNRKYEKEEIKIAFNPIEEKFEVHNPAILKDKTWLPDISKAINGDLFEIADQYFEVNQNVDKKQVRSALTNLMNIPKKQIGIIELSADLDIETVTEIFIRINSKGVVLSQADFVMSKIASSTQYNGNELRKAIDYFCHLANESNFYERILENDDEFAKTDFFQKMQWLRTKNDNIYIPEYKDLIRVAFTSQFNKGRLSDLVSLLSGRNFETRTYEESIAEQSFAMLKTGVLNFINETNFKRFLMIIKSAGFILPKFFRSKNAVNFAYIVYLKLKEFGVNSVKIESYVKRWLVYSILTGRYSGSTESALDLDIKQISQRPFDEILKEREETELSETYWNVSLPQSLDNSVTGSPYFYVFLAAQIKAKDKGFLSKDVSIDDLILNKGEVHHLFPKSYLTKNGMDKSKYNQTANL